MASDCRQDKPELPGVAFKALDDVILAMSPPLIFLALHFMHAPSPHKKTETPAP